MRGVSGFRNGCRCAALLLEAEISGERHRQPTIHEQALIIDRLQLDIRASGDTEESLRQSAMP